MSFKFNPFTGSFDRVEQSSKIQKFELAADQAIFNLEKIVDLEKTLIFEEQTKTITTFIKSGPKQITFAADIPAGTTLYIIQLS